MSHYHANCFIMHAQGTKPATVHQLLHQFVSLQLNGTAQSRCLQQGFTTVHSKTCFKAFE